MKSRIVTILAMAALVAASCSREMPVGPNRGGEEITFVIGGPSSGSVTRAIPDAGVQDNRVDEVTILLFSNTEPHNYVNHVSVSGAEISNAGTFNSSGGYPLKRFVAPLPGGHYKALILANAAGRIGQVYDLENGIVVGGGTSLATKTLADMENELRYTDAGKYNADPGDPDYRPFVMASEILTIDTDSPADYAIEPVYLARNAARIDVAVSESVHNFTISEIVLCDYGRTASLFPATDWWSDDAPLFSSAGVTRPADQSLVSSGANGIGYSGSEIAGNACVGEIFTWERPFAAGTEKNLSLLVRGTVTIGETAHTDRWFKLELIKADPDDNNRVKHVNVLRNYSYNITVTAADGRGCATKEEAYAAPAEGLATKLDAANNEGGMNNINYNRRYQLTVDRTTVVVGAAHSVEELRVYTNHPDGWTSAVAEGADWLSSLAPTSSAANATTGVSFTVGQNPGGIRRAVITFTADGGNLSQTVTVMQLPAAGATDNMPASIGARVYVGAFWKADQTGERLIRIQRPDAPNEAALDGEWTACVISGRGWISLDTEMTKDPNVGWRTGANELQVINGNDYNNFEWAPDGKYQVPGTATGVSGTLSPTENAVYFRIGLRSEYVPTDAAPARYGQVLLVFRSETATPYTRRIWIRQGHDADYLMYDEAINVSGTGGMVHPAGTRRPAAVRFLPYNLTDPNSNTATSYADPTPLDIGTGWEDKLTKYPSQAGYHFHWNYNNKPFHPTLSITNWTWYSISGSAWNPASNETCPQDYHRPNDGGTIAGSEVRQSLWLTPPVGGVPGAPAINADNSVWGYYADGWFDRRKIEASTNNYPYTAVSMNPANSTTRTRVAYVGRLFYNPYTNASLFFPAAGQHEPKTTSPALVVSAGFHGNYHTSGFYGFDPDNGDRARYITLSDRSNLPAGMGAQDVLVGGSVRCVKNEYE